MFVFIYKWCKKTVFTHLQCSDTLWVGRDLCNHEIIAVGGVVWRHPLAMVRGKVLFSQLQPRRWSIVDIPASDMTLARG
jgi:hypothetical protein